eukprot:scaffold279766_cov16-Prasinocladus_malaysianus.AAC.1
MRKVGVLMIDIAEAKQNAGGNQSGAVHGGRESMPSPADQHCANPELGAGLDDDKACQEHRPMMMGCSKAMLPASAGNDASLCSHFGPQADRDTLHHTYKAARPRHAVFNCGVRPVDYRAESHAMLKGTGTLAQAYLRLAAVSCILACLVFDTVQVDDIISSHSNN